MHNLPVLTVTGLDFLMFKVIFQCLHCDEVLFMFTVFTSVSLDDSYRNQWILSLPFCDYLTPEYFFSVQKRFIFVSCTEMHAEMFTFSS